MSSSQAAKKKSQLQDLLIFLYWRSSAAQTETLISWESLREQLWQEDSVASRIRTNDSKVYRPELQPISQGERIRITRNATEAKALRSVPVHARDLATHTIAPAIQQQKAPVREKTPQHEQAQKPPQREIQRGYGIGLSL